MLLHKMLLNDVHLFLHFGISSKVDIDLMHFKFRTETHNTAGLRIFTRFKILNSTFFHISLIFMTFVRLSTTNSFHFPKQHDTNSHCSVDISTKICTS